MTKREVLAWLNDLLFENDRQFLPTVIQPKHVDAITAAIAAISRPVRVEIWRDGGQHVSADKLIEVQAHEMTNADLYATQKWNEETKVEDILLASPFFGPWMKHYKEKTA